MMIKIYVGDDFEELDIFDGKIAVRWSDLSDDLQEDFRENFRRLD